MSHVVIPAGGTAAEPRLLVIPIAIPDTVWPPFRDDELGGRTSTRDGGRELG